MGYESKAPGQTTLGAYFQALEHWAAAFAVEDEDLELFTAYYNRELRLLVVEVPSGGEEVRSLQFEQKPGEAFNPSQAAILSLAAYVSAKTYEKESAVLAAAFLRIKR